MLKAIHFRLFILILEEESSKLLMERTGKDQESTVGCAKVSPFNRDNQLLYVLLLGTMNRDSKEKNYQTGFNRIHRLKKTPNEQT